MNDEYSNAFKSIVPEAPSSESWANGARRKRRNRTRVLAGVAGGAVIAMIVLFALALGGNNAPIATPGETGSPSPQVVTPSPDPGPDALGAAACWNGPGQVRDATVEGASDAAVRAWLCGDAMVSNPSLGIIGPQEPLVVGVAELVDFIQSQPEMEADVDCTQEYRLIYRVVLDYEDGSRHVVPGALHGCRTISDGPAVRAGGQELYDLALDLWRTQRESLSPPSDVATLVNCLPESPPREKRSMLPLDPTRAVRGFLCTDVVTEDGNHGVGSLLEDALVRLITDSIRVDSSEQSFDELLPSWLTLAGGWGEQLTLQRTSDDRFQWFDGDRPMLWNPPGDVLAQFDRALLVDEPLSNPEPNDPEQVRAGSEVCEGVASGDVSTTELDDGMLPTPEFIWLCDGEDGSSTNPDAPVVPLEPLWAVDLVARAAGQFNALKPALPDQACPLDAGPSYRVVYEYGDGTKRVVQIERAGCREATAGDQTWQGGDTYFDSLVGLWEEQRSTAPPVQTRSGPLCPTLSSVFDLDPSRLDFVTGSACIGWDSGVAGTSEPGQEVPLSSDLPAKLAAQLDPTPGEVDFQRLSGDSIVLVTRAGDPLALLRMDDGSFLVWGTTKSGSWMPTGDVAAELAGIFAS